MRIAVQSAVLAAVLGSRGGVSMPDALLGAEAAYWASDGPVVDGLDGISAWANLGAAGAALDVSQPTAGERLLFRAADPTFDGRPSAEGDSTRWMPGVATTLFDLSDGESLEMIWFGYHDSVDVLSGMMGTMNLGAGQELRCHTLNATIRAETQDDSTGISAAVAGSNSISAGVLFCGRYRLVGAAGASNDSTSAIVDGAAGTADADPLGPISPGASPGLGTRASQAISSGLDGRFALAAIKVGGWSSAEHDEIAAFLEEAYPSWGGAAA